MGMRVVICYTQYNSVIIVRQYIVVTIAGFYFFSCCKINFMIFGRFLDHLQNTFNWVLKILPRLYANFAHTTDYQTLVNVRPYKSNYLKSGKFKFFFFIKYREMFSFQTNSNTNLYLYWLYLYANFATAFQLGWLWTTFIHTVVNLKLF